jgi:putative transcriptional regulator
MSNKTTTVKVDRDGRMLRRTASGWEELVREPLTPTPPDFVSAFDPDNPPLTADQMKRMKPRTFARHLRLRLGLSQSDFSERYNIPIGTLRDWEQHRSEPDAPAKALLKLIAADPEGAAEVLKPVARTAAE